MRNVECYNDRGWTWQFRDEVEIVTNLFFYECKVVHIRQGGNHFKQEIVNCEICLHIVSIFCSPEKILSQMALC